MIMNIVIRNVLYPSSRQSESIPCLLCNSCGYEVAFIAGTCDIFYFPLQLECHSLSKLFKKKVRFNQMYS